MPAQSTEWPSGPFPPQPGDATIPGPPGISEVKIKAMLGAADACESNGDIVLGYAKAAGDVVVSAGMFVGEQLLHVSGVGTAVSLARHGKAAASTYDHMEVIANINYGKCTCGYCPAVAEYVLGKKLAKFGKRIAKAIPGVGLLTTIGEKVKGIYKMAKGTRGVNRRKNAAVLWIAAKEGCPTAKAMINELMGGPEKLVAAVANYVGILAIAKKMKST